MKEIIVEIQQMLSEKVFKNEEHIRVCIILRILKQLDWDIWNPVEVNTEFKAIPSEDASKVDIALFINRFHPPSVFIEVKSLGKIESELSRIEHQLRDYNRNNTAEFSVITDGQNWRFYYSQTGGEFSQKCFKILDLLNDDIDSIILAFNSFLLKESINSGEAKKGAINYLNLNQKQRALEDSYLKAKKLVDEPPFPSLPQALIETVKKLGFEITEEDVFNFISNYKEKKVQFPPQIFIPQNQYLINNYQGIQISNQNSRYEENNEPKYIQVYRSQLTDPNTLISKMKNYIFNQGHLTMNELLDICVRQFGCKSKKSGSIGASLHVLEIDGFIKIEGKGPNKHIYANK